jgi:hypothetical protein
MNRIRILASIFLLMLWSSLGFAAATTHSVVGDVNLTPAQGQPSKLAVGQRIESGAMIKTSYDGTAVLRFDDGQMISVAVNSTFVVTEYKFNAHKPTESSFVGSLVKGGIRAVTGIIGEANKQNVTIKTPTATMGIRGTDFQLYYDNRLYISVLDGAVSATNDAGTAVFDAKRQPLGIVTSPQSIPRPATANEIPAAAQAPFRQMQMQPLSDQIRKPNPADPTCSDRR